MRKLLLFFVAVLCSSFGFAQHSDKGTMPPLAYNYFAPANTSVMDIPASFVRDELKIRVNVSVGFASEIEDCATEMEPVWAQLTSVSYYSSEGKCICILQSDRYLGCRRRRILNFCTQVLEPWLLSQSYPTAFRYFFDKSRTVNIYFFVTLVPDNNKRE